MQIWAILRETIEAVEARNIHKQTSHEDLKLVNVGSAQKKFDAFAQVIAKRESNVLSLAKYPIDLYSKAFANELWAN